MSTPTVHELLHDASREVRSIMWEITTLDGPALAAGWPAFASQARTALAAVPLPDPGTRLLIHRAEGPRSHPNRWGPPVDAEPDPHLIRAGCALASVADLLSRYAGPPVSTDAGREADLVRRSIAECLFIGSHVTSLGLSEHATRLRPALPGVAFDRPRGRLAVSGASLAQSRRLASELDTFQAHAARYLARPCGDLRRSREQLVDPDRLPHALAAWEVAATRVLHAQMPSVRDLAGVARGEQALLVHTAVILNAAARACVIDDDGFAGQIYRRLQDAEVGWGDVAATWPAQMTTPAPPSAHGVDASGQLHRALNEITRDGNGWATPVLIGQRVSLAEVTCLLSDAVVAGSSRAARFAELPIELAQGGHLHAPARLLAAMEHHSSERGSDRQSAVRTTDVANRRIVVVRAEQTTWATATARVLGRQLESLVHALETLPSAGRGLAASGLTSTAQRSASPRTGPTRTAPASSQPDGHATARW